MKRGVVQHSSEDPVYVPGLDAGIEPFVLILRHNGIETHESCEGGEGHCFPEPTIRMHGNDTEGWAALAVAIDYGLPVLKIGRVWSVSHGIPTGPDWEMVFWRKATEEDALHAKSVTGGVGENLESI